MNQLFLVGRILVGCYYLLSAYHHFADLGQMTAYVAARHVPLPGVAVVASGLLLVIMGVSFLLGVLPRVGVAAAALFLLPVTLLMHPFWADADPAARMVDMVNFTKNLALLGSSLMFLGVPEPWPYSVHIPVSRPARTAEA
jgi:uncharacterized membrane protein YphA (DoxX/SURF4 family)